MNRLSAISNKKLLVQAFVGSLVVIMAVVTAASAALSATDCELAFTDQAAVPEPSTAVRSLYKFTGIHREISLNDRFEANSEFMNYDAKFMNDARVAVAREREIISRVANSSSHTRTRFELSNSNDFVGGSTPTSKYYRGLHGEVLQKDLFKTLNEELGDQGIWFIFRSYSWNHLGFREMAGPHMSIVIGNRVFEIGRDLDKTSGTTQLTTRGPAGPVAMTVDDFLAKTSLESAVLKAQPGAFFAERLAGVNPELLKALANHYELEAKEFREGKKFKYAMDPSTDPLGKNCVTYLTEPMLRALGSEGTKPAAELGLRSYPVSPVNFMMEAAAFGVPKFVEPILFTDNDEWRTQLDSQIAAVPAHQRVENSAFKGDGYGDNEAHPQMSGFFFRRFRFSRF